MSKAKEKEAPVQTVLYRKYRPTSWKEVVGQPHITDVLERSAKEGRIAHAYLFSGSRGTGKTTVARIFAQALGCAPEDIYEIDAASHNSVDDIRELRDGVSGLPFQSKYKVYILDEVHMLSKGAWNAFLKTLEEPPAHVIFILATTELEKVPETVVSRCQTFIFRKPTDAILAEVATRTAKEEGYTLEAAAAELVALVADGSFRDLQGTLEKVLAGASGKKISVTDAEQATGAPGRRLVHDYVAALVSGDTEKGVATLASVSASHADAKLLAKLIVSFMRHLILMRIAPTEGKKVLENMSESDKVCAKEILEKYPQALTAKTLDVLLEAYQQTRFAFIETLPLELALARTIVQDSGAK
jgi:DNA polymerase-3 subunit gamma/tau